MKSRVLSPQLWPSGSSRSLCQLRYEPGELELRLKLHFRSGTDDLDGFRAAVVSDPEIGPIALVRYDHQPEPGTEVVIDAGVAVEQGLAAVRRAGFASDDLSWTSDETDDQEPKAPTTSR